MILRDRIWNDLRNSFYYIEFLSLVIQKFIRCNRRIELALLSTTTVSIVGIAKFDILEGLWLILLSGIVVFRVMKPRLLRPETEVYALQKLKEFYVDHIRNLEELWYRYENDKITEKQAEKLFTKYNEEERIIIKIEKHSELKGFDRIKSKAEKQAKLRLKKYCNNEGK